MRRLLICTAAAGVSACLGAVAAAEPAPEAGAQIAFVRVHSKPHHPEISSIVLAGRSGRHGHVLVRGSGNHRAINEVAWSPDGEWLVFAGARERDTDRFGLFSVRADGSDFHKIKGTGKAILPAVSPDGTTIAYGHYLPTTSEFNDGISIWLSDTDGGNRRELTPRVDDQLNFQASFAPDGSLAYSRLTCRSGFKKCGYSIRSIDADGNNDALLIKGGYDPVYSPSGGTILFPSFRDHNGSTRNEYGRAPAGELYSSDGNGGTITRLTHTRGKDEFFPSWDPSGSRIVYTLGGNDKTSIVESNSDASCRKQILRGSKRVSYRAAAWRPGAGRGAQAMPC